MIDNDCEHKDKTIMMGGVVPLNYCIKCNQIDNDNRRNRGRDRRAKDIS